MPINLTKDGDFFISHPFLDIHGGLPLHYETSMEFAFFIVQCGGYLTGAEEWRKRCMAIAKRKMLYGILVDEFDTLTTLGWEVYEDINKTLKFILSGYRDNGLPMLKPEDLFVTSNTSVMSDSAQSYNFTGPPSSSESSAITGYGQDIGIDTIIPFGTVSKLMMRIMCDAYLFRKLSDAYNSLGKEDPDFYSILSKNPDSAKDTAYERMKLMIPEHLRYAHYLQPSMIESDNVCPAISNGFELMLHPVALRNRHRERVAINRLIMFGLLEYVTLPRYGHQKGRGRPPVGARITLLGTRFFELWIDMHDPVLLGTRPW